jgi:hypothetical protein
LADDYELISFYTCNFYNNFADLVRKYIILFYFTVLTVLRSQSRKEPHHFGGAGSGAPNLMTNIDGLLKMSQTVIVFLLPFTFKTISVIQNSEPQH